MDDILRSLVSGLHLRSPADVKALRGIAAAHEVDLPDDYVAFMATSDGADGDLGSRWLELWSVDEIHEAADADQPRYEGVLLFAGDGANTIYGFDSARGNEIVEGDWIGIERGELKPHGRTFTGFLRRIADT